MSTIPQNGTVSINNVKLKSFNLYINITCNESNQNIGQCIIKRKREATKIMQAISVNTKTKKCLDLFSAMKIVKNYYSFLYQK